MSRRSSRRPTKLERLLLIPMWIVWLPVLAPAQAPRRIRPYIDHRGQVAQYNGPIGEEARPGDLTEVLIGYFGPADGADPLGGTAWLGARLAIEELNGAGGYRGIPFRLAPSWSPNPWGSGIAGLVRAVYQDHLWGIIGSINGTATHLAEQAAVKARLTVISPGGTDETVNATNVAWMFSCAPGDRTQAPLLVQAMLERIGGGAFAVVSATDHDSRRLATEFDSSLAEKQAVPQVHVEFSGGDREAILLADRILRSQVEAVVVLADPLVSGCLVRAIRGRGFGGTLLAGPSADSSAFMRTAGDAAEGVLLPLLFDPEKEAARSFAKAFRLRFGKAPDCPAAFAYDGVRIFAAAVARAGLNRARIRDAVRRLSPWNGASGIIDWSPSGENTRSVPLGIVRAGRIVRAKYPSVRLQK